jgi:hypothetical protein
MVHATSGVTGSALHEIKIESPISGSQVGDQISVKGSVTIAPFENTLLVRILDVNNMELYSGPITVTAIGLGAPGTFDALVNISVSASHEPGPIRIEVLDISMADGSTIALDSVDSTLK